MSKKLTIPKRAMALAIASSLTAVPTFLFAQQGELEEITATGSRT